MRRITLPSEHFLIDSSMPSSIYSKQISFTTWVDSSFVKYAFNLLRTSSWNSSLHLPHQEKMRNPSIVRPRKYWMALETTMGLPSRAPQMQTREFGSSPAMRASFTGPPPSASNKQSNLYFSIKYLYSFSHPFVVTMICFAPAFCKISLCSSRRTMFSRGIFYLSHSLMSILPNDDAAAVLIIPNLHFVALNRSTNPMAVNGLIKPHAELLIGILSSISKISCGVATLYSTHEPYEGEIKLTLTPIHSLASSPTASTTVPVPSIPHMEGSGRSKQAPSMSK